MTDKVQKEVTVIGAGLAGSEAAWQLSKRGIPVVLYEMRPGRPTPAHTTGLFSELVCSNSLGSESFPNASFLLKEEMRILGSLIIEAATMAKVPAGKALGVDRRLFAEYITEKISSSPLVTVKREEVQKIPRRGTVLIATGPLTSGRFYEDLKKEVGEESLYFYDAVSPIVDAASIDMEKTFWGSRWEEESNDYLNIPLTRKEYMTFVEGLKGAKQVPVNGSDKEVFFEGCLPIEEMAKRGEDTLAFGPMKPVGFDGKKRGNDLYAVIQLRAENDSKTMFNIVGFQTRMTFQEQKRIFSSLPGLGNAQFLRLGKMHRNCYLNSKKILDNRLTICNSTNIYLAGQITGVEGYLESAATGLAASLYIAADRLFGKCEAIPSMTMIGALIDYITNPRYDKIKLEPMNANHGLLSQHFDLGRIKKSQRKSYLFTKSLENLRIWHKNNYGSRL